MATLAELKSRIADDLARDDLTTQIAAAITDAITIYQAERFRFSDANQVTPVTFQTVLQQTVYTSADKAEIGTLYLFDYLNVQIANVNFQLTRRTPEEIHLLLQQNTQVGQPTDFAYEGQAILFYPAPSMAYTITIGGHMLVPGPTSDSDNTNVWVNEGARLIRARAKYELAMHVTDDEQLAARMSPHAESPGVAYFERNRLKATGNKITGRGRMTSMAW